MGILNLMAAGLWTHSVTICLFGGKVSVVIPSDYEIAANASFQFEMFGQIFKKSCSLDLLSSKQELAN